MSEVKTSKESEQNSENKDINEVFEDLLLSEEHYIKEGYNEGYSKGSAEDNNEAFHLGYHRGAELGAELGYYAAVCDTYLNKFKEGGEKRPPDNIIKNVGTLKETISSFPKTNIETEDIIELANKIRTQFKKVCAQLKIKIEYPERDKLTF